ncbi:MAG: hypothetical protein DHS20C21_11750 [Gemmatimonadota bacterium]|nr:MAG: hypothetical protein DHS20C21_11750 [Gemmatimonadota bacterium]
MGQLTDHSGRFTIDLPPGRYEVRSSYVGYQTGVVDEVQITAGQTARVSFDLTVEPIEMNKIVVSASRKEERVLDAPASVQVVEQVEIEERTVLTPADHLQGRAGVDVQRAGVSQGTVVIRGFNNIFSGATLTLVDNRIARVPSLRYNALNLIPTANEDIEQIEVVSGPGSALYGPNSANGVMHIRTRSPFDSEGSSVSIGGGEQDVFLVSGRHAGSSNEKIGWKVSAQYYQATDFEVTDATELAALAQFETANPGASTRIARRDFDVDKVAAEGRLDMHVTDDALVAVSGGWNRINTIELTGLGAAQAKDWNYGYGQVKLNWQDFFLQGYVNASNSGDTYLLRTGADLVDRSKFYAVQGQHQSNVGGRTHLVYGVDGLFTRPDTDGTINGRNEDDDNINEIGGYVHSETKLSDQWDFVGALRLDDHNKIEDPVLSPRAALVYGPATGHKLRATYNRAYSTPSTNNLFLDLVVGDFSSSGLPQQIRAKGVPDAGFRFQRDAMGGVDGLYMLSPFTSAPKGGPTQFLPAFAPALWEEAIGIVIAGGGDPALAGIPTPTSAQVGTSLMKINQERTSASDPLFLAATGAEVVDIEPIQETINNTYEVGYKGLIGRHLVAAVDVYHSRIKNFVGPLRIETPNVFFDPVSLNTYLNGFLAPADAATLTGTMASIPLGTVSPENETDPGDLILTYRNFGDVNLTGVDTAIQILLDENWSALFSYSFVSEDFFENIEGELDLALNAPANKGGATVRYQTDTGKASAAVRYRWVDAFPVESGVYLGDVDAYHLVDLNAAYDLTFTTTASLVVQNLFDHKHREFVGTPELGRLAMIRVTQSF